MLKVKPKLVFAKLGANHSLRADLHRQCTWAELYFRHIDFDAGAGLIVDFDTDIGHD